MSRLRDERWRNPQKPLPPVMINIFVPNAGMAGTKCFSDKAHRDGPQFQRSRSDVLDRETEHDGIHGDDRPSILQRTYDTKSSPTQRSDETPMKMLISHEMSKETYSKQKPSNVVARLMGLDDMLPVQKPVLASNTILEEAYPCSKSEGAVRGFRQEEDDYFDLPTLCEVYPCSYEKECKDVYEVCEQPLRTNYSRHQAPRKDRCDENQTDKIMVVVRQKLNEAKCLLTDEKLPLSNEFRDALDVLISNRDLFIKFLEDPNSFFSKHMKDFNTISSSPRTKYITLLKPSNSIETRDEKYVRNLSYTFSSGSHREVDELHRCSTSSDSRVDSLSMPTRIVVLKPSPMSHDKKATGMPVSSSELSRESDFDRLETGEVMRSREIAKDITQQMKDSFSSHLRDESWLSSVMSNGYSGDDSSCDKSETGFLEGDVDNFSESEIMTPTSHNSWDYPNRMDSPHSVSSFSRGSCSTESSVIREAKKRLLDRWAMLASDDNSNGQMQAQGSSGTLGEMLETSKVKKEGTHEPVTGLNSISGSGEEDLMTPEAVLSIYGMKDGDGAGTLSRSRSVPAFSLADEYNGLETATSGSRISDFVGPKEVKKAKSYKASLKGIVASFFSRSKKSGSCSEEGLLNPYRKSGKTLSPNIGNNATTWGSSSSKATNFLEKPGTSGDLIPQNGLRVPANSRDYQDHPSPTSVLDPPFKNVRVPPSSGSVNPECQQPPSRSLPIESIVCSSKWNENRFKRSLLNQLKLSRVEEEEEERDLFIQTVLSSAGLDKEKVDTVFTRWHSSDVPLNPVLLVKLLDQKDDGEESRERRSRKRLLFDCINAALLDIGRAAISHAYHLAPPFHESRKRAEPGALISEEACRLLKNLFSRERNRIPGETEHFSFAVDRQLRKEVAGSEWVESMQIEIIELSEEIASQVLEDLVTEGLLDFSGNVQ